MAYRAWTRAGTALLIAATPHFSAIAQSAVASNPSSSNSASSIPSTVPILNPAAQSALQKAIVGNQRIEPSRDRWRNPAATLQFFGVRPTDTVIEVWPGQGWFTSILGPYLKQGSGSLVIGHFDASSTNSSVVRQIVDAYRARFASDQGTYGSVSVVPFGPRSGPLGMPGTADSVLTFRNIHNWMAQGWAEKAFGDFFLVLKPGGILGVEEHRGRTDEPQDPLARDGYVREDFVIQLAREAGFEFIGRSEINANPADTKDHPFGVWTLPPVSRTSPLGQRDDPGFDRTRYSAIGESDRMTLRFRKPLGATGAPPAPGTRWSPVIVAPAPPAPTPVPRPSTIAGVPSARPPVIAPSNVTPSVSTQRPAPVVTRTPINPPIATIAAPSSEAVAPRANDPAPATAPDRVRPSVQTQKPPPATSIATAPLVTPTVSPATQLGAPVPPLASAPASSVARPTPAVPVLAVPSVIVPEVKPTLAEAVVPSIETKPLDAIVAPVVVPAVQAPVQAPVPTPAPVAAPVRAAPTKPKPARPAIARPRIATPPVLAPPRVRPTPPPPTPQAATVARPATKSRAAPPTPRAPAVARPTRPAEAPAAKAKAKSTAPPRAPTRPAPAPVPKKKAAPPPPPDPNKPDWVVPRRRS